MDLDLLPQYIIIFLLLCTIFGKNRPFLRHNVYTVLLYLLIFCYSIQALISIKDKSDIASFGKEMAVLLLYMFVFFAVNYFAKLKKYIRD